MSWPRCSVFVLMFVMGAWVGEAHAQPPRVSLVDEAREGTWVGLSAGTWGLPEPLDDAKRSGAFDISIEQYLPHVWRDGGHGVFRLQAGHGNRYSGEGMRFDYRRVMVGVFREFNIPFPDAPVYIHVGGGAGAYRVRSAGERQTKSSLFAEAGFDVRLGSSPLSLGPEYQVHTIGDRLYDTASIVVRIRLP